MIIILHVNGLHTPIKSLVVGVSKKKNQVIFKVYKKITLNYKSDATERKAKDMLYRYQLQESWTGYISIRQGRQ